MPPRNAGSVLHVAEPLENSVCIASPVGHDLPVHDSLAVRTTAADDRASVLRLVREAFSDVSRDGHQEVTIVEDTWALGATVGPIDLVAVDGNEIVGHVLGARGNLGEHHVLAVAPLAVAPHQGHGVGTTLIRELLTIADGAGWPMAVLLGDPAYYQRFGFEPAATFGIVYPPVGRDNPHFQVRRLRAYDESCRGTFRYCWEQPEF